jgi:hypothetical protein
VKAPTTCVTLCPRHRALARIRADLQRVRAALNEGLTYEAGALLSVEILRDQGAFGVAFGGRPQLRPESDLWTALDGLEDALARGVGVWAAVYTCERWIAECEAVWMWQEVIR